MTISPSETQGNSVVARAIIRLGDKTSHGGTVLEAFEGLNVYGKPASGIGHKGYCPQCKCQFVIVAGAASATFMGVNVAVEGMQTSCGAVLIASQGQATIDVAGGASMPSTQEGSAAKDQAKNSDRHEADQHLVLHDQDGTPLAGIPYSLTAVGGTVISGKTNTEGKTQIVDGNDGDSLDFEVARKTTA